EGTSIDGSLNASQVRPCHGPEIKTEASHIAELLGSVLRTPHQVPQTVQVNTLGSKTEFASLHGDFLNGGPQILGEGLRVPTSEVLNQSIDSQKSSLRAGALLARLRQCFELSTHKSQGTFRCISLQK